MIQLFWKMVLHGAASFRSASACLKLFGPYLAGIERTPTAWCGELWILRIGLYELYRVKDRVADRVWLVDHTVQIGTTKCLLIVGVRLSWWQDQRRPLAHDDLEILTLEPVENSDGETVRIQLECTAELVGVPRAIVSDQGADLKRGIADFQQAHRETAGVCDIAHKVASIVKGELEAEPRWGEFLQHLGRSKPQLQQTKLAFLIPPTPKTKARYMNLEELARWGVQALEFVDHPQDVDGVPVDRQKLEEKLGWLRDFRRELGTWQNLQGVISTTLEYIRYEGYHRQAACELARRLKPFLSETLTRRIAAKILAFVKEQSVSAVPGERLIGSSEVLESLIGTGKRMERQQSKSGFTKLLLAMAAAIAKPTAEYLKQAMADIKTEDVYEWANGLLGRSVQSQRRLAFAQVDSGTETR
jgi:hypothetical protein